MGSPVIEPPDSRKGGPPPLLTVRRFSTSRAAPSRRLRLATPAQTLDAARVPAQWVERPIFATVQVPMWAESRETGRLPSEPLGCGTPRLRSSPPITAIGTKVLPL